MAGRYATALFELALEAGATEKVAGDLGRFEQMLTESPDLVRLVRSPIFSAEEQTRALEAILGKAGVEPLTLNFFRLIAKNRRLFAVPDMIKGYKALLARQRNEVEAEVVSAHPLTDAQTAALKETLKASVGRDVALTKKVDPAILGGLVVKIGSRMIDSSLRTKLNSMKYAMKEVR
jgi:F-type H+-transporting ATPase subunit delta